MVVDNSGPISKAIFQTKELYLRLSGRPAVPGPHGAAAPWGPECPAAGGRGAQT
jgi:hypothetical protein